MSAIAKIRFAFNGRHIIDVACSTNGGKWITPVCLEGCRNCNATADVWSGREVRGLPSGCFTNKRSYQDFANDDTKELDCTADIPALLERGEKIVIVADFGIFESKASKEKTILDKDGRKIKSSESLGTMVTAEFSEETDEELSKFDKDNDGKRIRIEQFDGFLLLVPDLEGLLLRLEVYPT